VRPEPREIEIMRRFGKAKAGSRDLTCEFA
jgi:hypothetical protein